MNRDDAVIAGFGQEWTAFDQTAIGLREREEVFSQYFAIFPWERLPDAAVGADLGCGSGRWAAFVAPRVAHLHLVEPSEAALLVARRALALNSNVTFHRESIDSTAIPPASLDFAYSLGVLHHVPDTARALRSCADLLKPGAVFLVYLYYAFDNKPQWFRKLWRLTDGVRRLLAVAPFRVRLGVSGVVAVAVYLPLSRVAKQLEMAGRNVENFPLSYYRHRSFYVMRNDALDRFGTRLEQRFTRAQIAAMLADAGFENIQFSPSTPYWTAVATRSR